MLAHPSVFMAFTYSQMEDPDTVQSPVEYPLPQVLEQLSGEDANLVFGKGDIPEPVWGPLFDYGFDLEDNSKFCTAVQNLTSDFRQ